MGFQIGGAILDFIVIAILNQEDEYGYVITQKVRKILDVSETAMYPALKRLEKNEVLEVYDTTNNGRNRRYYKLTTKGKELLDSYIHEWEGFKLNVEALINGGGQNDCK